jgi:thiamine-phosphate pyrophosphorylase
MDPTLLVIVDAEFVPRNDLARRIAEVARGGATWLQIRAKGLATGDFIGYARVAAGAARDAGIPFLINDRADIALLLGADGVHVGEHDLPVADARAVLGGGAWVGATARDGEGARMAEEAGASYVGVGPLFPTSVKPSLTPLPAGRIAEIRRSCSLPLVGIGGIDRYRAEEVARRGLDGMAVISALWKAADPEGEARELVRRFRRGKV